MGPLRSTVERCINWLFIYSNFFFYRQRGLKWSRITLGQKQGLYSLYENWKVKTQCVEREYETRQTYCYGKLCKDFDFVKIEKRSDAKCYSSYVTCKLRQSPRWHIKTRQERLLEYSQAHIKLITTGQNKQLPIMSENEDLPIVKAKNLNKSLCFMDMLASTVQKRKQKNPSVIIIKKLVTNVQV